MTWPVTTKNNMLNGQAFTHASLHSAFPGSTGANELSGGLPAYARKAITMGTAAGGVRALSAPVVFDIPAATYVRFVGFWSGSSFVGCAANGGANPRNFMSVSASDTVYSEAHGYVDTQKIVFMNGTPPVGLTEGTTYFVRDATVDNFKVAATSGGTAINLTTAASFGCVVTAITETLFSAQGTHTLNTVSFVFPD